MYLLQNQFSYFPKVWGGGLMEIWVVPLCPSHPSSIFFSLPYLVNVSYVLGLRVLSDVGIP